MADLAVFFTVSHVFTHFGIEFYVPSICPFLRVVHIPLKADFILNISDRKIGRIFPLSVNSFFKQFNTSGRSLMNIGKSTGPRTRHCGIPLVTGFQSEVDFRIRLLLVDIQDN